MLSQYSRLLQESGLHHLQVLCYQVVLLIRRRSPPSTKSFRSVAIPLLLVIFQLLIKWYLKLYFNTLSTSVPQTPLSPLLTPQDVTDDCVHIFAALAPPHCKNSCLFELISTFLSGASLFIPVNFKLEYAVMLFSL